MIGNWHENFMELWSDSWFFRLNVVLTAVGLLRLFIV